MNRLNIAGLIKVGLTVRAPMLMLHAAGKNPATGRRNLAEQAKNRHNHLWFFYARHLLSSILNRAFQWRALNGSVRAGCACSQFSTHFGPAANEFYSVPGGLFPQPRITP